MVAVPRPSRVCLDAVRRGDVAGPRSRSRRTTLLTSRPARTTIVATLPGSPECVQRGPARLACNARLQSSGTVAAAVVPAATLTCASPGLCHSLSAVRLPVVIWLWYRFACGANQATTSLKPGGSTPATPLPEARAILVSASPAVLPSSISATLAPLGAWLIVMATRPGRSGKLVRVEKSRFQSSILQIPVVAGL